MHATKRVCTKRLFGRPLKPKMIAQYGPSVLGAESSAALQDGHDVIDKRRELVRQCRTHDGEPVDRARVCQAIT